MSETERGSEHVVLVALDGSSAATAAVPVACTVARQLNAQVEALYVATGEAAETDVRSRLGLNTRDYAHIPLRIAHGDPAEEILRAGEDPRVALVVLATHGRRIRPGGALAPVPRRVAAGTSRPVLLVRPEAAPAQQHLPFFRRLLFPVDGTPTTVDAFATATELAARLGTEIDVLFVVYPKQAAPVERGTMTPPYYVDQPHHEWPAWQTRVAHWIRRHCADLPQETVIRARVVRARNLTEVGEVIARFAAERAADGIVLVRRSHLEHGRAAILRAVLERTPCPVLLVAGEPQRVGRLRQRPREAVA
ncbi:MAG TPA: universal stress protein [Chloroflexota bacterium]|nr:universal stress protein [Chloroflexota bacterium]